MLDEVDAGVGTGFSELSRLTYVNTPATTAASTTPPAVINAALDVHQWLRRSRFSARLDDLRFRLLAFLRSSKACSAAAR